MRYSQVDHIICHYSLLLTSIEQLYSIICLTVFKMLCLLSLHWHAQLLDTVSFFKERYKVARTRISKEDVFGHI